MVVLLYEFLRALHKHVLPLNCSVVFLIVWAFFINVTFWNIITYEASLNNIVPKNENCCNVQVASFCAVWMNGKKNWTPGYVLFLLLWTRCVIFSINHIRTGSIPLFQNRYRSDTNNSEYLQIPISIRYQHSFFKTSVEFLYLTACSPAHHSFVFSLRVYRLDSSNWTRHAV